MVKILIVDDSNSMRQMVTNALSEAGYEITEATDGVEALKIAAAKQVDLVVTDVNMPNLDGIGLVRELRLLSGYKFVPILLLTTESAPVKKAEGKEAGATGWLTKPFDPEKLLTTIKRVLG